MILPVKQIHLDSALVSGTAHEGLSVSTQNGRPARLAIIDENGKIIEAGDEVAAAAWNIALTVFQNFLKGQGHLRVLSKPKEIECKAA